MDSTFDFVFHKSELDKIYWRFTLNDNRYQIKENENSIFPNSAIGLLKIEYCNEIVSYRTGILIGENVILTAGHNLHDNRKNPKEPTLILGEPTKIEFYPGLNKNKSKFNVCNKIKAFYYPSDFKKKPNEDYGIIILSENIGKETGYFHLQIFDETIINSKEKFFITGYPLNKTENDNTTFIQYKAEGKIYNLDREKGIITHNIKSSYGESGSGFCYFDSELNKYFVIGVHVASNAFNDDEFYSTMITKKRFTQIQKWINESKL